MRIVELNDEQFVDIYNKHFNDKIDMETLNNLQCAYMFSCANPVIFPKGIGFLSIPELDRKKGLDGEEVFEYKGVDDVYLTFCADRKVYGNYVTFEPSNLYGDEEEV